MYTVTIKLGRQKPNTLQYDDYGVALKRFIKANVDNVELMCFGGSSKVTLAKNGEKIREVRITGLDFVTTAF